ncbi:MAG: LysR family transcriptional regulator ArgP [Rhodobacteraceae bacterium]|nr:LysR family transcriptional regulator ArgP [Paracoccaceae bacterium]
MKLDYDAIEALAAVIREGQFDAAAESLNITQSRVSQRIKHLEQQLGGVLIVRGRPCKPTEMGLQVYRHSEQVSLLQYDLEDRLSQLGDGGSSSVATVRLSVNNDSLATWFPKVIHRASQELGLMFDILPDDQEHTEQKLKSGDALGVITSIEEPVQGCRMVRLGQMDYIAVAAPDFYEQHFSDGVTLESVSGARCLSFDRKDTIQDQWLTLAFGEVTRLTLHFVPSYEGYIECCLNGSGWGLVPGIGARKYIASGELVELAPGTAVQIPLNWQARKNSSEILRRLGDLVLEEARTELTAHL